MRLRQILVFLIFACGVAGSAQADERAWFFSNNSLTEVAVTLGGREWTPTWAIALPPHQANSPIVWGGGRYLVWSASTGAGHWLVRLDTRSRQLAVFPVALDGPASLAIERDTTRLVVLDPSALYVVDVEQLSVLAQIAMPGVPTESRSLAVAQRRIFAGHHTEDGSISEVVVLHAWTLEEIRRIPGVWYVQASRDERHVYLQTDTASGVVAQVWEVGTLTQGGSNTVVSWARTLGFFVASLFSGGPTAVSASLWDQNTLAQVASAVVPQPHTVTDAEAVQASPHSPIVLRTFSSLYGVRSRSIQVFEPTTFTMIKQIWQAPFDTFGSKLVMLGPPDPLLGFSAVENASTRTVLLEWGALPDIAEYQVVVGSAPGLSDLATISAGRRPNLMIRGVPPGTYYVRVRAINDLGAIESPERRLRAI